MTSLPRMDPLVIASVDADPEPESVVSETPDGRYFFYDEDFPLDYRIDVQDKERPMRSPNLSFADVNYLVLGNVNNTEWLRHRIQKQHADEWQGQPFPYKLRTPKKDGTGGGRSVPGRRPEIRMTIPDIERLCHVLFRNGSLEAGRFVRAIKFLKAMAAVVEVQPRGDATNLGTVVRTVSKTVTALKCPHCGRLCQTNAGLASHYWHNHDPEGPAAARMRQAASS